MSTVKRKKAANYISCDPFPKHREADERIKELSKAKRSGMTNAESILWYNLRNRFTRHKFRRQFSINDKYIVDFICLEKRLIIEVDGGQHNESRKDKERTGYLGRENFRVIRLWNNDIYFRLSASMEMIYKELEGIE